MKAVRNWVWWIVRGAAAAVVVGGVTVCYSWRTLGVQNATAFVFCAILALGGALALLTRGIGPRLGMTVGAATGLATALGLVMSATGGPLGNMVAFVGIATAVVGVLGYLAGAQRDDGVVGLDLDSPAEVPVDVTELVFAAEARPAPPAQPDRREEDPAQPTVLAEEILGSLVKDLFDWAESDTGRDCCLDAAGLTEFATFLGRSLWSRVGAQGARLYLVSADGELLEPVSADAGSRDEWPSRRLGLIGHVVATGRVYVAGDAGQGELIAELAAGADEAAGDGCPRDAQRWAWLLPLRADRRTCALLTVDRVDHARARDASMAHAVRNQLELFWAYVRGRRALARHGRLDAQSGLLNRAELLVRLPDTLDATVRAHEPLVLLVLSVEGLRALDDAGRWTERDAALRRVSRALAQKVRQDDMAGRFSEDRFVIVLRRLDSALGTVLAEKLMEAAQTAVLDVPESEVPGMNMVCRAADAPCVRAGLAGFTPPPPPADDDLSAQDDSADAVRGSADAKALLTRAIGLLTYARQQRIDIVTDLMKGLPPELMAGGDRRDQPGSGRPRSG